MTRHTTFRFTLRPTAEQEQALRRHAGASRFAYNQSLQFVTDALAAKRAGADVRVPWSGFDRINAFNRWKISPEAGVDEHGNAGLAWRGEVLQQVFEEAAVDLGRALAAFSAGSTSGSNAAGFPKFKSRYDSRQSCRIRNKGAGNHASIRIGGAEGARRIRLSKLGVLEVRESTRNLRRMLAKGREIERIDAPRPLRRSMRRLRRLSRAVSRKKKHSPR